MAKILEMECKKKTDNSQLQFLKSETIGKSSLRNFSKNGILEPDK